MKNLILITIAISSLFIISCKKTFLERYPTGQVSRDQLLNNVVGVKNALIGSYTLIADYQTTQYGMYGDLRGDNIDVIRTAGNAMLSEHDYISTQEQSLGSVGAIWTDIFAALNNVNNILQATETLEVNGYEKRQLDSLRGQALVLRALCNLNLSQVYSQHYTYTSDASHLGIPILFRTPTPGSYVSRATIKETYAQILKDLGEAITRLKVSDPTVKTKATSYAAQALRSRVYLYMENWQEAINDATAVLNSGKFDLEESDSYTEMYIAPGQYTHTNISSEVIWQLNKNRFNNTNINVVFSDYNRFSVAVAPSYMALFDNDDVRKQTFGYNPRKANYYTLKYSLDTTRVQETNWPVNIKIIRSAELYLNRAEANWHLQNYTAAVDDLKTIRARAYNKLTSDITVTYSSPQDLLEQILTERNKELGFENHRIYDIVRNKKSLTRGNNCSSSTCTVTYPNNLFVLPIPSLELDANPLMQPNPGVNN